MLFDLAHMSNIPQELQDIERWVCWKSISNEDGTVRKIPVNPHTRANASSTDRNTWGTFAQAIGTIATSQGALGLGFVFSSEDTIFGLDIDHCIIDGELNEKANALLTELSGTYAELSPSGTGVHLYGYGPTGKGINARGRGELYGQGRFFTVTGQVLSNRPLTLSEFSPELMAWLVQELSGVQGSTPHAGADTGNYQDIELNEDDESEPSMEKILEISDKCPNFYGVWKRKGKQYESPSEEEMVLGRYAVIAGWQDQDIYQLLRAWRQEHNLPAKHIGAYQLTLFNLRAEPAQQQSTSGAVSKDTAREILAEFFPLPIHALFCLGTMSGNYRAIVGDNKTLRLGPYEELEKQSVWRKVIFQQAGQAMAKINAKRWQSILAAFAAITEVEDVPDMTQTAETEQWLEDFIGNLTRGKLTYEIFRRDETFSENGVTHIRLSEMLAHVNRTYGNKATRADLAERLRVLGWRDTSITCVSPDGAQGVKTYWALPV